LYYQLQRLFAYLEESLRSRVETKEFFDYFRLDEKLVNPSQQMDAMEFLDKFWSFVFILILFFLLKDVYLFL
jgi:hypothetical protein